MKTSNLIIGLIVIIVIIGGFFFFTNRAEAPETTTGTEGGTVTDQVPASGSDDTDSGATAPAGTNDSSSGSSPIDTTGDTASEPTGSTGSSSTGDTTTEAPSTDTPAQPTSSVTVVRYTSDGFTPSSVTIKQGDTVRFVNEAGDNMWVGSDIHPTHSQYAGKSSSDCLGSSFDQCTVVGNGGSWEFTFDEKGTWGYHNHVRASKRGTVVVN